MTPVSSLVITRARPVADCFTNSTSSWPLGLKALLVSSVTETSPSALVLLTCCTKVCANRAERRGLAGLPIGDADTAQMREAAKRQKKAEHQQQRLQHKQDAGKRARLCDWCGKAFEVRRNTAKFCTASCRDKAARAKPDSGE